MYIIATDPRGCLPTLSEISFLDSLSSLCCSIIGQLLVDTSVPEVKQGPLLHPVPAPHSIFKAEMQQLNYQAQVGNMSVAAEIPVPAGEYAESTVSQGSTSSSKKTYNLRKRSGK